ncbi:Metallo-dependent phosphatase [Fomitopsis serialis]|uniref:Metallo-dependent phosphatase n=1 Tax=Fomitopsis serialis TaxID=139415 RepID=UPI002008CB6E|nr:Metallo-dependent phosphatase [Neoantrodia serialis]KAH9930652.1 Metallo-dependent phosphatase [Neoantrodia serialis]
MSSSSATVYVKYNSEDPPPHPGPSWTRFVCISDTHSHVYKVPPGDVLLHAGDLSAGGAFKRLKVTLDWLKTLPHPVKVLIAGNHDLCLDEDWQEGGYWANRAGGAIRTKDAIAARRLVRSEALRNAGMHYLEYESTEITTPVGRTRKVYGSPAAPRYSWGAFQYDYNASGEIYSRIPEETEILLTHTPPYGILNQTRKGTAAGCKDLARRLASDDLRPCRLHVFGHIHESHGAVLHEESAELPCGRVSVNAALAYGGQGVIVDLKN